MRILTLWKYKFRSTHYAGKELFGDNYYLLRHEDLLLHTEPTLRKLYDFLEKPLPTHVLKWATGHINSKFNLYAPDSPHWQRAFREINMQDELKAAGYDDGRKSQKNSFVSSIKHFLKLDNA